MAEDEGKAVWEGRPGWWGGWQGQVPGLVGCLAGWGGPGGDSEPGRVGWRAGLGGWPAGQRGLDYWSKECSGVNKVT